MAQEGRPSIAVQNATALLDILDNQEIALKKDLNGQSLQSYLVGGVCQMIREVLDK